MKNELFKKANSETEFTPDQLVELKKCKNDPIYFISTYIKIQHPSKGAIVFDLYDYQKELIESFTNNRFNICKLSRQSGKTTTIAAYLLWYAVFNFDKVVLVASNKNSNAMEIMARVIYAYEELPMWLKPGVRYGTKHSLEFDNGSKVVSQATTENTGRGLSISLLMLDELAFVPKRIQEELWTSIAPTISTGGSCIISSTPNGDDDLFASLWTGAELGTNGFAPISIEWDRHPDRDDCFKQEMMMKVGEEKWAQEYECQMISSDALLISSLKMQAMKPTAPIATEMGYRFWAEFDPTKSYLVGVDVATGVGSDFSVVQIIEFPSLVQVAEFRSNKVNIPQLYGAIKWGIKKIFADCSQTSSELPDVYWSFENNGVGQGLVALYYNDESFPDATLLSNDKRVGLSTTGKNKIMSCIEYKNLIEKTAGGFVINSDILIAEMKNFVQRGGSYAARNGATDDVVSAMLIIVQMIKKAADFDEEAFDMVYNYQEINELGEYDSFSEDPVPMVF